MTATPTIPDVLPPAGATEVHDWRTEDGKTARRFWGSPIVFEIAPVGSVVVQVAGAQFADATAEWWIETQGSERLTSPCRAPTR